MSKKGYSTLDPHGGYTLLNCMLAGTPMVLLNIYAANTDQIQFLHQTLDKLFQVSSPLTIVGGDFNVIISPYRDRYLVDFNQKVLLNYLQHTWVTIDLIDLVNKHNIPALLLSLHAQKAIDRLKWLYMFSNLRA